MSEHPDEYEVGYKNPPKSGQFQPGKSGNPKGRPKKPQTQTPGEIICEVINGNIMLTENGKTIETTKLKATMLQLQNKALKGDLQSIKLYFELVSKVALPILEKQAQEEQRKNAPPPREFKDAMEASKYYKSMVKAIGCELK